MNDIQSILDDYLEKIKNRSEGVGHLSIKELAYIIGTGERKIINDIERGRLGKIKMGPDGSKCRVRIPTAEALGYVLNFFISESNLPPIEDSSLFSKVKRLGL